ncbi:MAG TPA: hypothetical protein VFQ13_07175 [Anaerolineales bacterium]|nr:hypothetical protein [Anaerolineales bacterium]
MSNEIITSIIAASVALISVAIGIYGQVRTTRLQHQLVQQREVQSQETKATEILAKYRDPLLRAAYDLQSRLFRLLSGTFLGTSFSKITKWERTYLFQNTMYILAEYLGWVEILRREVRFLDLGNVQANRRLAELMESITEIFFEDSPEDPFRLLRGEQRAIGEIMIAPNTHANAAPLECIGYATFVQKLKEPDFKRWFRNLHKDIEKFIREPTVARKRTALLQHALIDLIDFLDPDCARIPESKRKKFKGLGERMEANDKAFR